MRRYGAVAIVLAVASPTVAREVPCPGHPTGITITAMLAIQFAAVATIMANMLLRERLPVARGVALQTRAQAASPETLRPTRVPLRTHAGPKPNVARVRDPSPVPLLGRVALRWVLP